MLRSGLVSVTFRNLPPREIVRLAAQAGLEAVEWGGDVHVPHGDLARAREVRTMTADAGVTISSYGSYYHVGESPVEEFLPVLRTAQALGSPVIRVWAGKRGSAEADAGYRRCVIDACRAMSDIAADNGIDLCFEFHGHSLTDTAESARRLLEEIGRDNVKTYWQPPVGLTPEECLTGLEAVLPWVTNVHAYHWGSRYERMTLAEGAAEWSRYLKKISSTGRSHFILLEFVRDDDPAVFLREAATLKELLAGQPS